MNADARVMHPGLIGSAEVICPVLLRISANARCTDARELVDPPAEEEGALEAPTENPCCAVTEFWQRKGLKAVIRKCCLGKGTKFVHISLRSTFISPWKREELVR
jgi:hypothetical protein